MDPANPQSTETKPNGKLAEVLHKKTPLRLVVCATLLGGWYIVLYQPKEDSIAQIERTIKVESKRLELATKIGDLRAGVGKYASRIPTLQDSNDYYQSILEGVRTFPITLNSFTPDKIREQGPYRVLTLRLELECTFSTLDRFLRWVESNGKLMRVDGLRIDQHRKQKELVSVQLQILGLAELAAVKE